MKKRILLATDLPIALFATHLANMLSNGLMGIEIFPEIISEPSMENECIVAYSFPMPKKAVDFIRKHKGNIHIVAFLTPQAAESLGETLHELPIYYLKDRDPEILLEVTALLESEIALNNRK